MRVQVPGLRIADPRRAAPVKSAADRKEAADTERALLLIGPGMTLEIIVEGVVTAVEILHLIMFFEAANDDGHSVPHRPNQGIGWPVRFPCRYEFSKTFQFAPSPLDIHTRQDKVWSDSFQPRKEQHLSLPARALAHDPVPQFPLRHSPSKQRYGIGQEVGVAAELQFFFEQAYRAIFCWSKVRLELGLAPRTDRWSLNSLFSDLQSHSAYLPDPRLSALLFYSGSFPHWSEKGY